MPLNRLFDLIERAREAAGWRAAFGEPQVLEQRTVIPVAQVSYGFGLGFGGGDGAQAAARAEGEGEGGAGGGGMVRPLGAFVVTPERLYFEEAVDATKITLAGIGFAVLLLLQVAATIRAFRSHKKD